MRFFILLKQSLEWQKSKVYQMTEQVSLDSQALVSKWKQKAKV